MVPTMASHKQDTTPRLRPPTLRARPSRQRCMTAEAASAAFRDAICAAALVLDVDLPKLARHRRAFGGPGRRRKCRSQRQCPIVDEAHAKRPHQSGIHTAQAANETAHFHSDEEVEDIDVALMTYRTVSLVSLNPYTPPRSSPCACRRVLYSACDNVRHDLSTILVGVPESEGQAKVPLICHEQWDGGEEWQRIHGESERGDDEPGRVANQLHVPHLQVDSSSSLLTGQARGRQ